MDKNKKNTSKKEKINFKENIPGSPHTAFEQVNKYGRCNIQPTADADNEYPAIAQGLSEKWAKARERDQHDQPEQRDVASRS